MRLRVLGWSLVALTVVVAALLPLLLNEAQLDVYVLLALAAMVTLGVSLLMGYAGQVSLGQGAFYAIGAYTAGMMAIHGWGTLVGLICAPVLACVAAAVVAVPIMRLRGHYLAFATMAVQLVVLAIVGNTQSLGGSIGLSGIPPLNIGPLHFSTPRDYAWLSLVATLLLLLVARNIAYSRPGRGLRALATSEVAAESSGVPVIRYRIIVFAISAAFAGLAGGIYAYFIAFLSPGSFPLMTSFEYVIMAVLGGLGTVWGAVIGAGVITLLVQGLNALGTIQGMPTNAPSVFTYAAYALILVLGLLLMPRGLLPTVSGWLRNGGRQVATAGAVDEPAPAPAP